VYGDISDLETLPPKKLALIYDCEDFFQRLWLTGLRLTPTNLQILKDSSVDDYGWKCAKKKAKPSLPTFYF